MNESVKKGILPRERVIMSLSHDEVDRVPLDFWAVQETWEKLIKYFGTNDKEKILQRLHIDVRQFQPKYIGKPILKNDDGTYFDAMGVHRRIIKNDYCEYEEYASSPLGYVENINDFASYDRWPDIDNYDFIGLSDIIGDAHKTYYIKMETGGIFELAWALRGYERFMMDMVLNPEIAHYILERITDFWCEFVERSMKNAGSKIDMVYTYDDIGTQNSLLMSKEMWKEFLEPCHKRLNKVIHKYKKTVMYHSCGAIYDIIHELKKLPIDVLNPLQPRAKGMDFNRIKNNYGKELSFHGGIDIQDTLPNGKEEDVREEVRNAIDILGKDGGYILTSAHYIQGDTPVENIVAMYDEAVNFKKNKKGYRKIMGKQKIIIDTDCGSDDAMAIAMALNDPNYEILFFSTVAGNVDVDQATYNTLMTIEYAGTYEPPVYRGCDTALIRNMVFAHETHGMDGMGDIGLKVKNSKPTSGHAVNKIIEALDKHDPGEIEIITLGTLTNIALAIRLAPDTMRKVKRITIMGTAGLGVGNVTPVAEFNIWQDAEAAKIVNDFGVPIMYVGWDACIDEAMLNEEEINRIRNSGELGKFVIDCNTCLMEMNKKRFGEYCLDMADPSAIAAALNHECIKECEKYYCEVDTSFGPSYGGVLVDQYRFSEKEPNAYVCSKLKVDVYKDYIFKTLGA
ncbi:hypothetical protein SH1V18_42640 [Vallitalea longa]|uniref:Uroporphyrinogen decarboxylase (URO-D) domain-containing protein n=1 Tax=Vallitalea longa TaxID=2936439 RepID=A0A9W5YEW1_9FIRM|nr:nucleoside hydrolase [Vallitalea longa]GKX31784.1 hypothetical protein SH1V18_42640 [Vallitalea longa]